MDGHDSPSPPCRSSFYRYRRVVVGVVKCFRHLLQLSGVVVDRQWWLVSEVMGCDGM